MRLGSFLPGLCLLLCTCKCEFQTCCVLLWHTGRVPRCPTGSEHSLQDREDIFAAVLQLTQQTGTLVFFVTGGPTAWLTCHT